VQPSSTLSPAYVVRINNRERSQGQIKRIISGFLCSGQKRRGVRHSAPERVGPGRPRLASTIDALAGRPLITTTRRGEEEHKMERQFVASRSALVSNSGRAARGRRQ
jgi:hypothetical protein